ncbi:MAG: tRNA pseudouridine(55) synthase TruB [bacterium]
MKDGILIIDKPSGTSSFGVVKRVRYSLGGQLKVGHTGTLDPAATGVLVLCIGKATKLAEKLSRQDKEYQGTVKLGERTDTLDREGTILETGDCSEITAERIEQALAPYRGEISQLPPMYSAVKHKGKRLYKLARKGEEVERKARKAIIHHLQLEEFNPPYFTIRVGCSKGTYIRALADDIGRDLGCGACLWSLVRTGCGHFSLEEGISLAAFEKLSLSQRWQLVLPLDDLR